MDSILNILLVFTAIFLHYGLGRFFIGRMVLTPCLVGLAINALVVAILANFATALIQPYLCTVFVVLCALNYHHLKHAYKREVNPANKVLIAWSIVVVVIVFIITSYPNPYIIDGETGKELLFNYHYSYYASQSFEMLNGDYLSRLRIQNIYPAEWTKYHFFNAATQAISQYFLSEHNLMSYMLAKHCIMAFIMGSIFEHFMQCFGLSRKTAVLFFCWILLGLTLFKGTLTWNFLTTGAFSVFAMVHLLFFIYKNNTSAIYLFSILLGASVIRLMPFALLFLLITCYYNRASIMKCRSIKNILSLCEKRYLFLFSLFGFYNLATVFAANGGGPVTFFQGNDPTGWLYVLSHY